MWSTVWESLVQAETLSFCGIWTLKYLMVDITVSQTINSSTLYETKTMTSGFSLYHQKLGKIWVAEYQTLGPLGYKIYYKGTLFIVCLITYNISVSLSWPESACFWKSLHYKLNYHLSSRDFFPGLTTVVLYSRLMHFKIPCGLAQILFNREAL